MPDRKPIITSEMFEQYARENNKTVIIVDSSLSLPVPQRRRDEALAINGFADIDREAILIADWLINRFSGASYGHLRALTERAVEFIGGRVVVADDTVGHARAARARMSAFFRWMSAIASAV